MCPFAVEETFPPLSHPKYAIFVLEERGWKNQAVANCINDRFRKQKVTNLILLRALYTL